MRLIVCCLLLFCSNAPANAEESPERIEVRAQAPTYKRVISRVLPQQQVIDETSFSADSLANMMSQIPAVNLNGQGGLLQTVNIRGFARWRIQTLVEGIPIYSERRAGTSVEFVPPDFIGQAHLTQGAASTQLGSGALGGGLDLSLSLPQQIRLKIGHGTSQDYRNLLLEGKTHALDTDTSLYWQVNHRHANNSEDGAGNPIQDRFEHNSFSLRQQTPSGMIQESLLLYSEANNIAKASADNPQDRFTLYPENRHLLGKLVFDWHNASIYLHDSSLSTVVTRPGTRVNQLQNDSLDIGLQLNNELSYLGWQVHWRAGVDGRTGVKAYEQELDVLGTEAFAQLNLDAQQWESSLSMDASKSIDDSTWVGGARLAYHQQKDRLSNRSENDVNVSAFVGYGYKFGNHWKLSGYISNAYRVPSLTERYFTGSTPRGTTLGDPNLKTETALNIETNLMYSTQSRSASIALFRQEIDDYIERVTINSELRQYRNLDSATIEGINYQFNQDFEWQGWFWQLKMGGQWLRGEDQSNDPIADITPAQHRVSLSASSDNSTGFFAVTHRASSEEIVAGENPTAGVTTLDVGFTWQLNANTKLSINITNLTDKLYVTSRDDLAPFARGRDIHASVAYVF